MLKHTIAVRPLAGAAALLLATAPAAWADLQARTLWADWQQVYNRFGGTLSAEAETYADGRLTLTGVSYRTESEEGEGTATYGTITLIENDDGTVAIEIPAEMQVATSTLADETRIDQTTTMRSGNMTILAREDGTARVYDIAADNVTAEFDTVVTPSGEEPADPTLVTVRLSDVESELRSGLGAEGQGFAQTFAADALNAASTFSDGAGAEVDVSYALIGISSAVEGIFGEPGAGPVRGLGDLGITYGGTMEHAGGTQRLSGTTPDGPIDVTGTSESGSLSFQMGEDALTYSVASVGSEIRALVPGFPIPVDLSMAEIGGAFTLPAGEPGEAKPFGMQVTLRDLLVDDTLWSLFDPTGQLPRDPATLVLDLDGTAEMKVDIFGDPDAMARLEGAPGALKTLTLNQLLLTVAGAQLRGTGDLTFPNGTPVPEPVGTIELALDGGFALLDRIVALGFIPAQQAQFLKGMSGAVTRSVGEDELESTIEFTPGGGITANGLPLR